MRRIVAAGHELCNHMPHDRSYALLGEPAFAADLRAAEEALALASPSHVTLIKLEELRVM